jgi:hypothetical protein
MSKAFAKFPFNDLHSFKDYVVFVRMCAPNYFPSREGLGEEAQWSLDLAFRGLHEGLELARREKGDRPLFHECNRLVDEAYREYKAGNRREGFVKLEEVNRLLKTVPSQ